MNSAFAEVSGWLRWGLMCSVCKKANPPALCSHTCACVHVSSSPSSKHHKWWAGPTVSMNSQRVSSFMVYSLVKSFSLIKSLQLLIDWGLAHPEWEWQHWAHLMGCFLDCYIYVDQIYLFTSTGACAQKESRNARSAKLSEIKCEEGSKIP